MKGKLEFLLGTIDMDYNGSESVINSEDLLCETFRDHLELYKVYEFRCPPYVTAETDNWINIVRIPKYVAIYSYNCFGEIDEHWIIKDNDQPEFERFINIVKSWT